MNGGPPLDEKVALVASGLHAAGIDYAIGGALALAYYAEPRGTIDIDVNVFVGPDEAGAVFDVLEGLGVEIQRSAALKSVRSDGQVRVRWGHTPVDLFFATDAFHEVCARRVREVPFGTDRITILAPEDLVVFKATYDRRKDWLDIEQVLFTTAGELDTGYVRDWLERIVGGGGPRLVRFDEAVRTILG